MMTEDMVKTIAENCLKDVREAKEGSLTTGLPDIDNLIQGCLNDLTALVEGAERVFSCWDEYLEEGGIRKNDQNFNFGDKIKIAGKEKKMGGSSNSIKIGPMNFFKSRGVTDKMLEAWFKEELGSKSGIKVVLSVSAHDKNSAGIKLEKKRDGNEKPWRCHFYFEGFKPSITK